MIAANIVQPSLLHQVPDLGLLEMVDLVVVRSSKVCAHASVVARDDDTAATSRCLLVNQILGVDTGLGANVLKKVGVLVLAYTADVQNRVWRQHVLKGERSH